MCRLGLPNVRTGLSLKKEIAGVARSTREMHFPQVRVGRLSLCSTVLPVPLSVTPMPAPACFAQSLSHDCEIWRVLPTTSDVGNATQGPGVPDHQIPHGSSAERFQGCCHLFLVPSDEVTAPWLQSRVCRIYRSRRTGSQLLLRVDRISHMSAHGLRCVGGRGRIAKCVQGATDRIFVVEGDPPPPRVIAPPSPRRRSRWGPLVPAAGGSGCGAPPPPRRDPLGLSRWPQGVRSSSAAHRTGTDSVLPAGPHLRRASLLGPSCRGGPLKKTPESGVG